MVCLRVCLRVAYVLFVCWLLVVVCLSLFVVCLFVGRPLFDCRLLVGCLLAVCCLFVCLLFHVGWFVGSLFSCMRVAYLSFWLLICFV